jgi:hypothetical protein
MGLWAGERWALPATNGMKDRQVRQIRICPRSARRSKPAALNRMSDWIVKP